jgi:hypothetical protein
MKLAVPFASLVALLVLATPATSHAQTFQVGGGSASASTNSHQQQDSVQANAGMQSSIPGILSVDDTTRAGPIKADSLAHIQKYAQSHHPVVIIDHKVKTVKDFANLKATSITTYKIQEASDRDITYYGNNAKNGIITVTLVPPKPPQKPAARKRR